MTESKAGRAAVLICAATLALALGCASDKDAPVYDTAANPHGLPIQACNMLDAIEAGQMVSYDVITESFGRLYLENQELLENKHWKEIITRLGDKFHSRADELIKSGVRSYSQAAGFYMLASFSAPDDAELAKTAALFTTWREMTERVDAEYACSPISRHLAERLGFIRHFVLGDSLQRDFAEQFLVHQLLDSILTSGSDEKLAELSDPDRALLAFLKLGNSIPGALVGQFTGPAVDLIAYRLVAVAQGRSRIELYMTAPGALATDYRIMLSYQVSAPDVEGQVETKTVVKEFDPFTPTSRWKPGETMVVTTVLGHTTELSKGQIVLTSAVDGSSGSSSTPVFLSLVAEMPCSH